MKTNTVLITGASSGIGYQLAKCFAESGHSLVIVGRHEETLNEAARKLQELGAPSVITCIADLFIPGAAERIYEFTKVQGLEINILVNDAGMGVYGNFKDTDIKEEIEIIQLNIVALTELTKYFLRDMLALNDGKILQLASVASYQPTPKLAVYAATKAYILSLTDAIIEEIKGSKVTLTSLIPAATDTDFFINAGAENTKAANDNPEDPAVVAKIGFDALMKGEQHAYAPTAKRMAAMSSITPNSRVAHMAGKFMEEDNSKE